jgi:cyclopropane fatty-acyl-phospholipid synthase-like methyltransferase
MAASTVAGESRMPSRDEGGSVMRLVEISAGYWLPRALQVVADLGVADKITDEARTAKEIAAELEVNADALNRLLRLLASHGIFERVFDQKEAKYGHNKLSRALREDHPQSVKAYVRLLGLPVLWDNWGKLGEVVRSGGPAIKEIFGYFQEHPEVTEIFDAGMKSKAQAAIGQVIANYDFSGFKTIADVGGGLGHLLKAILAATPNVRGILFDQPHVVNRAELEPALQGRMEAKGGDFFKGPLPRCDAYVVMEVLHDWTDEQSREILRQVRRFAPDEAKLLVVETVLPDESAWEAGEGQHFGNHLDINMLVLTGGRERTPEEFAQMFSDSGWRMSRVVKTASPYSIVEALAS